MRRLSELMAIALGGALRGDDVSKKDLELLEPQLKHADEWLRSGCERDEDGFGWLKLPYQDITQVLEVSHWLSRFDALIQIGIGGSALGNRMLHGALLPPYYNEFSREERHGPRFYLMENLDSRNVLAIWELIDPSKTAFVVVSKSGQTTETAVQFLWAWQKMTDLFGESAKDHFVVVTDPHSGILRRFADEVGCRSLPIPQSVGGRYSVLSPVGLLSAATLDIEVESLLKGAQEMDLRLSTANSLFENPAWLLAGLHYLHSVRGRNMTVLMPYADALKDFTEWFAQLWAESLGKGGKGSTPIRALGAVDQHSQLQLYSEGPDDKLFTLLEVRETLGDLSIPFGCEEKSLKDFSYLKGQKLGDILNEEAKATAAALAKAGRPVIWMELPRLEEHNLGALIFLWEYVTALCGALYGVNPFDQPGVEQSKRYAYGLLGRKGFEDEARDVAGHFGLIESFKLVV